MEIIVSSHIIAAALQVIGVGDVALPHHPLHSSFDFVLEAIVSQYINLSCVVGSIFYLYLKLQDTKTTVLRVIEVIKSVR